MRSGFWTPAILPEMLEEPQPWSYYTGIARPLRQCALFEGQRVPITAPKRVGLES
jgi:hypothetical protein